jgi:hypothetical protein
VAHFLEEVRALVERRAWEALKKTIEPWPPADIADLLLGLDKVRLLS